MSANQEGPSADQLRAVIQFGAILVSNLIRQADKPNGRAEAIAELKAWAEAATSEEFSDSLVDPNHVDPARSLRVSSAAQAYQMHRGVSESQALKLLIEDIFLRGIPEVVGIPLASGQRTPEQYRVNSNGRRIHGYFSYNNLSVIGWADGYLNRLPDEHLMTLIDDPKSHLVHQYRNGRSIGAEQRARFDAEEDQAVATADERTFGDTTG